VRRVLIALVLLLPATASAHLGSRKYLRVEVLPGAVEVAAEVEAIDASMELGLGEDVDEDALLARTPAIHRWLTEGIAVEARGEACEPSADPFVFVDRDERRFLQLTITYDCPSNEDLVLRDDTVFPDDPQHEANVRVAWSDDTDAHILRRGSRELELGGPVGMGHLFGVFLWEGVLHFVFGYDHVLFLLSLVLAAGFVAREKDLKAAFKDVAILVTAFTVGHSVTLIAAALEVVVLPSQPVEIVIAASIAVVAALNLYRPEKRGAMPWLALGFGLIHGFGFSSVLAEVGLPRVHTVVALVSFNLGIELAQLAFVALVIGPIAFLAKWERYVWVVRGGSALIGMLAIVWVIERL